MRHINALLELSAGDITQIFDYARRLKDRWARGDRPPLLAGQVLTQVFEKPSLRTRVSFEAAMMQLGGSSLFLNAKEAGVGVIVLRTFSQELIDDFIRCSGTSIINGLSDVRHPCQALTDLFTMREVFGDIQGKKLVFVGDGNNVATSLAAACALLQVPLTICAPDDYRIEDSFLAELRSAIPSAEVTQTGDFSTALKDAAIIYTDVWTSMGQEAEAAERRQVFASYQVNAKLMKLAPKTARFMHCLPAKRGQEVTDDVIDGPQSIAFQQAENRMHLAKGLLCWVLGVEP
ncbi:MAG: ornithine carbamoyltransferase [Planctomycetales bacterium 12-60-4]|nr:MAG: ornithine carbamoyltransferase [Planctomycetales bacterium 12-60-4]